MTVVIAAHFIEYPLLASDGRVTHSKTKEHSDTASKIIPIDKYLLAGIYGNPAQAAALLNRLSKEYNRGNNNITSIQYLRENVHTLFEDVLPVNIQNSRCGITFAGINPSERQFIKASKVKEIFQKKGGSGPPFSQLVMAALNVDKDTMLPLNIPKSYIFTYQYPSGNIVDVDICTFDAWGSGADYLKDILKNDMNDLWEISMMPKQLVMAIALQDAIEKAPPSTHIGGLPQIWFLHPEYGPMPQAYSKTNMDGMKEFEMIFEKDHWVQKIAKTGKIVKTFPKIISSPKFDSEEIVEFLYKDK